MEEKEKLVKKNNALVIALIFVVLADIFWGVLAVRSYNNYKEINCSGGSVIPSEDDWYNDHWCTDHPDLPECS